MADIGVTDITITDIKNVLGEEITIADGDGGYGGCSVTLPEAGAC